MSTNFRTVLIDVADVFEREIDVLEYFYWGMTQWALVRCENGAKYVVPLFALAIKHVPLFGVVND